MAKQTAVNLDITNNADGFDVSGGTTSRKLTLTSGNVTIAGSGAAVITFPSTTGTLANIADSSNTTGTIIVGGNSIGAAITVGTNDANAFNIEANNTTRISVASGGEIQIGVTNADLKVNPSATASAIVQITSTSRGVLFPATTASGIGSISSPAANLIMMQTDGRVGLRHYVNSSWVPIHQGVVTTPSQITSNQANYTPSNFAETSTLKLSTDGTIRQIQGMAYSGPSTPNSEDRKTIVNNGTTVIQFPSQHPSATAAYRFDHPSDYFLLPGQSVDVRYDGSLNRWKFIHNGNVVRDSCWNSGVYYDYVAGSSTAGDNNVLGFNTTGAGTITSAAATTAVPAALVLSTSTSASGAASVYFTKDVVDFAEISSGVIFARALVSMPTLSTGVQTFTFSFGILDGASTDQTITETNSVGIEYSHGINSGEWNGFSHNSVGTETNVDLNVAVAVDTLYDIAMYIDMAVSEVRFYVNGSYAGRNTANLPSSGTLVGARALILKSVGTTARTVNIHRMDAGVILP